MTNGLDYDNLFVAVGWYPTIYELKIIIFILFLLTSIVMNNALIGLAVGDANEVMKSASFDKFLRRVRKTISYVTTAIINRKGIFIYLFSALLHA